MLVEKCYMRIKQVVIAEEEPTLQGYVVMHDRIFAYLEQRLRRSYRSRLDRQKVLIMA